MRRYLYYRRWVDGANSDKEEDTQSSVEYFRAKREVVHNKEVGEDRTNFPSPCFERQLVNSFTGYRRGVLFEGSEARRLSQSWSGRGLGKWCGSPAQ